MTGHSITLVKSKYNCCDMLRMIALHEKSISCKENNSKYYWQVTFYNKQNSSHHNASYIVIYRVIYMTIMNINFKANDITKNKVVHGNLL